METFKVLDNVFILKDSYNNCSNLVIGKDKALLFDTGLGIENIKAKVEELTDLPLIVINSHGHLDHVGGNTQFDKVYIDSKDQCIFENYSQVKVEEWIKAITGERNSLKGGYVKNFNTKALDFNSFDLGELECFVIKLAGHSKGSIGIFIPKLKLLLSGDALLPLMTLYFDNYAEIGDQLETLDRVLNLDFKYYLTGHSEEMYPKSFVRRLKDCAERSLNKDHEYYEFPAPPYSSGYLYKDLLSEDEIIGIIVAEYKNPS